MALPSGAAHLPEAAGSPGALGRWWGTGVSCGAISGADLGRYAHGCTQVLGLVWSDEKEEWGQVDAQEDFRPPSGGRGRSVQGGTRPAGPSAQNNPPRGVCGQVPRGHPPETVG